MTRALLVSAQPDDVGLPAPDGWELVVQHPERVHPSDIAGAYGVVFIDLATTPQAEALANQLPLHDGTLDIVPIVEAADERRAIQMVRHGASDYLVRPVQADSVFKIIETARGRAAARGTPEMLGAYRVLEPLNSGGMAEVLLAEAPEGGGQVVLKRIRPDLTERDDVRTMFMDEARLCSMLEHDNIVRVRDFGRSGEDLFLVMDYVEGCSLGDLAVAHEWRLPMRSALFITSEVCAALGYAHSLQVNDTAMDIIHRDVNPPNILLGIDGRVYLTDFGIAKFAYRAASTMVGLVKGKISYMAPEQMMGEPLDGRTDLFSLGVILYRMLTSVHPFHAAHEAAMIDRIRLARYTAPTRATGHLPAAVDVLMARFLARRPSERFANAYEARDAVLELIGNISRQDRAAVAELVRERPEPQVLVDLDESEVRPAVPRTDHSAHEPTRFLGRYPELRELQVSLDRAVRTRTPTRVLIAGGEGTGKSRMLGRFFRWLGKRSKYVRVLATALPASARNLPYAVFRNLIADDADIRDNDDGATVRAKLEQRFGLDAEDPSGNSDENLPHVTRLLGFPTDRGDSEVGVLMDYGQVRTRGIQGIADWLKAMGRRAPLIILVDDLDHADPDSLSILQRFEEVCVGSPILIVATAPDPLGEALEALGAHSTLVRLEPFGPALARELIASLVPGDKMPTQLVDDIAETSGGNPALITELCRVLSRKGVADNRASLPTSLRTALRAHVNVLPELEAQTLQAAAVVGPTFWSEAVAAALEAEDPVPITTAVAALAARGMIQPQAVSGFSGRKQWRFVSALLRDTVYEGIERPVRDGLHRRIGGWLVEEAGDHAIAWAGIIGEHLEAAGDPNCGQWFARAGLRLVDLASDQAVAYLRRANERLPVGDPNQLEVLKGLGNALEKHGDIENARSAYDRLAALSETLNKPDYRVHALVSLTGLDIQQGRYGDALTRGSKSVLLAESTGDPALIVFALTKLGWAHARSNDAAGALEQVVKALKYPDAPDGLRAGALRLRALAERRTARFKDALFSAQAGLKLARAAGDLSETASFLNALGETSRIIGRYEDALAYYKEAQALFRRIGSASGQYITGCNVGIALVLLHNAVDAEASIRGALKVGIGIQADLAEAYAWLARACVAQQKFGGALSAGEKALTLARKYDEVEYESVALAALGEVAFHQKEDTADSLFEQSVAVVAGAGYDRQRAHAMRIRGRHLIRSGETERGRALVAEAKALFEKLGLADEVRRSALQGV